MSLKIRVPHLIAAAACSMLDVRQNFAQSQYAVTAISAQTTAINNDRTVVVGFDKIWTPAAGLQSLPPASYLSATASALSSNGLVGGTVYTQSASPVRSYAAVWGAGQPAILPTLRTGEGVEEAVLGVNAAGVAVGYNYGGDPFDVRAVRWHDGIAEDLSTVFSPGAGTTIARAINDSGQILVTTDPMLNLGGSRFVRSYVLDGTTLTLITSADPAITGIYAAGINALGRVTGTATFVDGTAAAFSWQNGLMTLAPPSPGPRTLPAGATAINAAGAIVGAMLPPGHDAIAMLWDGDRLYDLNDEIDPASGWYLYGATGINDNGDITGNGLLDGVPTGFLLTRVDADSSTSAAVPEPATAMLCAPVLVLLCNRRRSMPR